eukprot:Phypoly_transcript_06287.p1 GENE.Phypoly_transcript_06287~~Phypoly_transcript_06287.p1  ORF type:complete len:497 (+),score=120.82 Phypoly_transcript_06287:114-1604(+)
MEEPVAFDSTLESFFNQIANPFADQEIVASQMFHLYHKDVAAANKEKGLKRAVPDESPSPTSGDEGQDQAAKQKNRRVNQNIASRNYRNRKKEYVTSLESKVSQLTAENDALKKEIAMLKRVDNFDSMRPDPSLISMVVELRHIMSSIADAIKKNADDSTITYLLQLFHLVVEKRHHIFEKEVEKLVNPFAQAKLAVLGYTPVLEYPAVSSMITSPNTDGWWAQFMLEAKITPAQMQKLSRMRNELAKCDQELRQERLSLDSSIKEFYLHKMRVIPSYPAFPSSNAPSEAPDPGRAGSGQPEPPVEVSDAIELSRKLNLLKKNFCTQRNLMINAFSRTSQMLTPRQQALLLVKLQIQTRFNTVNMDLLKNVWESVTSSEAPVASLLSMMPKDKEVPTTTTSPALSSSYGASLSSSPHLASSPHLSSPSVPLQLQRPAQHAMGVAHIAPPPHAAYGQMPNASLAGLAATHAQLAQHNNNNNNPPGPKSSNVSSFYTI